MTFFWMDSFRVAPLYRSSRVTESWWTVVFPAEGGGGVWSETGRCPHRGGHRLQPGWTGEPWAQIPRHTTPPQGPSSFRPPNQTPRTRCRPAEPGRAPPDSPPLWASLAWPDLALRLSCCSSHRNSFCSGFQAANGCPFAAGALETSSPRHPRLPPSEVLSWQLLPDSGCSSRPDQPAQRRPPGRGPREAAGRPG